MLILLPLCKVIKQLEKLFLGDADEADNRTVSSPQYIDNYNLVYCNIVVSH